jgi:anti-sigma B factor antagonist
MTHDQIPAMTARHDVSGTSTSPSVAVLPIVGDVDLTTSAPVAETIKRAIEPCPAVLVLDLTDVSFLSSAGLSVLIETEQKARKEGIDLRLVAARREVLRPLQITGLTEMFHIYPTVTDATGPATPSRN